MYEKSREKELTRDLFENPTSEYRGAPFWAWNHALDKDTLCRHIEYFKEMGMGGFHMHSRTGLDTPYLGEEFMDCVRACVEKAKADWKEELDGEEYPNPLPKDLKPSIW